MTKRTLDRFSLLFCFSFLLLFSLFEGWAQELPAEKRKTYEKAVERHLPTFYDSWLSACVDGDNLWLGSIDQNYALPQGVFKPDFHNKGDDGQVSFRGYVASFQIAYDGLFERDLSFELSDFSFLSVKFTEKMDYICANFTYRCRLMADGEPLTSTKVEAVVLVDWQNVEIYKIQQIAPVEEVLVYQVQQTETEQPVAEPPVVAETPKVETPVAETKPATSQGSSNKAAERMAYLEKLLYGPEKRERVNQSTSPNIVNGHEYVDLGLSVKWATCNVGANSPEGYGDYFAWGETNAKSEYSEKNSLTYGKRGFTDISGNARYDAARAKWGGNWRMPTDAELTELSEKCKWIWATHNGYTGFKVVGPNGNSIFIPAAGYKNNTSKISMSKGSYLWSAGSASSNLANCLLVSGTFRNLGQDYRNRGLSIRPVLSSAPQEASTAASSASVDQTSTSRNQTFTVNGVSFTMVRVAGGTFQMGATSEQENPWDDEKPVHRVTLSGYSIGATEVTQALWKAVMGSNPSSFKGDNLPVEKVSWNDCQDFIRKLNALTGKTFRLPTEAEWEFAARGGNQSRGFQYSGSNTLGDVAWYGDNSGSQTHPVASKSANELGLYDMSGNVWEWCQDWEGSYSSSSQTNPTGPTSGSLRVYRGGSWNYYAWCCRVAFRDDIDPSLRSSDLGLRLAL